MQAGFPKVAIVLLNWDGLLDTIECLKSVQKIAYPNYTVVVVDNGSKGNDAELIKKEFGNFVYLIKIEKNRGFTGGCNVGLRWALCSGAEYVLLLNNDTVVDPDILMELVNVCQKDTQIGIVGAKNYHYEQPNRISSAGGRVNFWTGVTPGIGIEEIDDGRFDDIIEVDYVSGAALLIKVKTIRQIGLLSEIYWWYYEETDWCQRARKAGFKVVFVPRAKIWHKSHAKKTISANALSVYFMTRNRFLFVRRNSTAIQFVFFNIYFLMTDLSLQMKNKMFMRPQIFVAYLKGIRDGVFSLAKNRMG